MKQEPNNTNDNRNTPEPTDQWQYVPGVCIFGKCANNASLGYACNWHFVDKTEGHRDESTGWKCSRDLPRISEARRADELKGIEAEKKDKQ